MVTDDLFRNFIKLFEACLELMPKNSQLGYLSIKKKSLISILLSNQLSKQKI